MSLNGFFLVFCFDNVGFLYVVLTFHFVFFSFFRLAGNDRGYGHWRFAGAFTVALRQSECGRKACEMHVSQQVTIGVCYLLALVV